MATNRENGAQEPAEQQVPQVALPEQKQFFKIPARFGHVPVAEQPLGYDAEKRFEHLYPRIELPFQLVDAVETAAKRRYTKDELFPNGLNRLFFGDCLHVMRMLPSECIDLIYIDPPFFSGRNYNIIFGDRNEVRSFSDIWEGGMPGYLIWLNARLYEMKRLLKPTGSIYVHLDWHAVHYVKVELDKLFGCGAGGATKGEPGFRNEVTWCYSGGGIPTHEFPRKHDSILWYTKSEKWTFNTKYRPYSEGTQQRGRTQVKGKYFEDGLRAEGTPINDWWTDVKKITSPTDPEKIGYPTQKSEELLARIVEIGSDKGDVVADFFSGGGTTAAVAQMLGRRWVACDISRVAAAISADRIARILAPNLREVRKPPKTTTGLLDKLFDDTAMSMGLKDTRKTVESSPLTMTGHSVEHWGIYEVNYLTKLAPDEFRAFVLACYGARKWTGSDPNIHGAKQTELLWVGGPKESDVITATNVRDFAQAVMQSRKPEERQAVMISWGIDPKARAYADQLVALGEQKPVQFIRLKLWPLPGEELKSHVTKRHPKYRDFFAFILPPDVPRIGVTRVGPLKYRFDVTEARSMNPGGKIINVQWDFDFRDGIFSASQGYQLCRTEKKGKGEHGFEGQLVVEYEFEGVEPGSEVAIACRVQDDVGGEGTKVMKVKVE